MRIRIFTFILLKILRCLYYNIITHYQKVKASPASGDNIIIMTENENDSAEVSVARCSDGNISCKAAFVRTVLNIENYKGNPKMEVLYPLIRALEIDAREIFSPEMQREAVALRQLRLLIEECSEEEAAAIIPIFKSVLTALRDQSATPIK